MPPRPASGGGSTNDNDEEVIYNAATDLSMASILFAPTNHPREEGAFAYLVPRNNTSNDDRNNTTPGRRPCCFFRDNSSKVLYSGRWLLNVTEDRKRQTTHSTTDKGAKARFRFEGSKVIVFGTVPATNASDKPPTIRYSIDKQNSMELTVPVANTAITNQPLFSASNLRRSPHELVIELVKGEAPYILEQFFVQPHPRFPNGDGNARGGITRDGDNGNDGGKGNGPGPSFPPRPMGSGNIPGSRSPSSTAAPVESPSDSSEAEASTRAVQILSGTLGALIALILLGVLIYFLRRRQITKRKSDRFFSKFFKYASPRPETIYTSFTTPESIQRNEPSFLMRGSSAFTQGSSAFTRGSPAFTRGSEGPPSDLRVSMVSPVMVQSMPRLSMATIPPARLNATTRS